VGFILQVYYPIYFIVSSGALYLIIGNFFKENYPLKLGILIILILLILPSTISSLMIKNQVRSLVEYIQKRELPKDKIIVHTFCEILTINHYYKGNLPIEGFYPLEDNLSKDLRIVKKNWQDIVNEKNVEKLKLSTKNYKRIFLIEFRAFGIDPENLVFQWFIKNNWCLKEKKTFFGGLDPYTLYLFEKI